MSAHSVHLATLGCRLNEAEIESWARGFRARGLTICADPQQADLVVLNTCAVTAEASRKSRQWLRRLRRINPSARLILSGCDASLSERDPPEVDLIVVNADKDRLVEIASQALALPEPATADAMDDAALLFQRNRHRAFIKVQDGCRYRCSFCIVTLARGEERSRPIAEVVEQVSALHAQGLQEIVLAGVHLGGYGSDQQTRLSALIEALLERTRIPRIRLGSLEPWELDDGFLDLFADPRLMPHLHLPLQSGSDSVLRRMSRRCRTGEFADLLARARARVPNLHVSTDIIVGFPGETDAEWQDTLAFVEAMRIGQIHGFTYSARAGTRAATLPGRVDAELRRARMSQLRELADQRMRAQLSGVQGQTLAVLLEGVTTTEDGRSVVCGYTPNWLKVEVCGPRERLAALQSRILPLQLLGLSERGDRLLARLDPPETGGKGP